MNQNSDLRFDLSEETAVVADASLIVRARFVEAADTMLHIDVKGLRPAAERTYWPEIRPEQMDNVEVIVRYRPSAAAISRAEEVMYGWMFDYVSDDERRILLGNWSMCLAVPHIAGSFRNFCKKTGRVRRTAERRLQNEFQSISSAIIKKSKSLQEPNWSRVSPMMPNSGTDLDIVRTPMVKSASHWLKADAKPFHDPESPELEKLIKRLEKASARREREAKKRQKAA